MRKNLLWIVPFVLLTACTQELREGVRSQLPAEAVATQEKEPALIPGSMIVQVSEDLAEQLASGALRTKSSAVNAAFEDLAVTRVERLFPDAGEWEPRHRKAGLHRWFRISYAPVAQPATKAAQDFSSLEGVECAEPERNINGSVYFNDPYAPKQWALYNDGSLGKNYVAGIDVNVEPVWSKYTTGSSNVIVAVIDGGVQLDHPDLAAATIPGGADGSRTFIPGYTDYVVVPTNHGTHVAGTIAAVNNNGRGVCGIAGGSDGKGGVRILSCAAMVNDDPDDPDKEHWGSTYNAMVWAADHGAVIANNSWGYVYENEEEAMDGGVGGMGPAIDYFIQYAGCDKDGNQRPDSPMKGGVVFFGAGNDQWQASWPAQYEKVIAVGAVNAKGTRSSYSNYGDWVDICAPGGETLTDSGIMSTVTNGEYKAFQGTSMACPHVSGVAALIVSYYGGPGFTNEMLKKRLLSGADRSKVAASEQIGPLVDALGAFDRDGEQAPLPAAGISSAASANTLTLSWKVTADPDNVKAYAYLVLLAADRAALQGVDPHNIPASVKSAVARVGTLPVGETISASFSGLEFETPYYAAVFAYDYASNYSDMSAIQTARTGKNNPPVVTTDYTGDYRVKPFEKLTVDYVITEPDGHDFTLEVDPGSEAVSVSKASSSVRFVIAGNGAPHGRYTAHVVATDVYGAKTDYPVQYEILENHAPTALAKIDNLMFDSPGPSVTFDLKKYFQDEDGEPLVYTSSSSDESVARFRRTGDSMVLTAAGYGMTEVSISATDACNKSCTLTFLVLVRDPSRPVDLYPNPVEKILNIRPGTEGQLEIALSNKAGATVWSGTQAGSPFAPIAVDMSGMAGGTYYVRIQGAGIDDVYPIAKR